MEQAESQADPAAGAQRMTRFHDEVAAIDPEIVCRGRGMVLGIDLGAPERAERVLRYAFDQRVVVELCGRHDEVVKLLPPLNIDLPRLDVGLGVLGDALLVA